MRERDLMWLNTGEEEGSNGEGEWRRLRLVPTSLNLYTGSEVWMRRSTQLEATGNVSMGMT